MPADRQVLPGRRTFLIRVARATAAALFLMGTSVAAVVVEPAPVVAIDEGRGSPGHCPDADGVTVVIDFQELGGDTIIRCAPGDQETGHSALVNAGIEIEGTNRWGESFICRIEGKPGPEDEPCIDTPPASAYWSYWHAPNDGAWTYSQWGVMNRTPPPGSFEGVVLLQGPDRGHQPAAARGTRPPHGGRRFRWLRWLRRFRWVRWVRRRFGGRTSRRSRSEW